MIDTRRVQYFGKMDGQAYQLGPLQLAFKRSEGEAEGPYSLGWVATPYLGQLIVSVSQRMIARRWFAKVLGSGADAAEFAARSTAALDAGCGWALASLTQAYFSAPAPVFSPISQPALVIWGAQDRTHRMTDRDSVLQYFRDAESVSFETSGHSPELEQPDLFSEHLVRLIEQR
jgi:pimeloyl-ACP methyl ester carboxylesterase